MWVPNPDDPDPPDLHSISGKLSTLTVGNAVCDGGIKLHVDFPVDAAADDTLTATGMSPVATPANPNASVGAFSDARSFPIALGGSDALKISDISCEPAGGTVGTRNADGSWQIDSSGANPQTSLCTVTVTRAARVTFHVAFPPSSTPDSSLSVSGVPAAATLDSPDIVSDPFTGSKHFDFAAGGSGPLEVSEIGCTGPQAWTGDRVARHFTGVDVTLAAGQLLDCTLTLTEDISDTGQWDVGMTCGTARFDFYNVIHESTSVKKGELACLMLYSNRDTKELLDQEAAGGDTITLSFAKNFLKALSDRKEQRDAARDALKDLGFELLDKVIPHMGELGSALGTVNWMFSFANDNASVGAAAFDVVFQAYVIRTKGACMGFVLDIDHAGGKLRTYKHIVYNPSHWSGEREATYNTVYQKQDGQFRPRMSNLGCGSTGFVKPGMAKDISKIFSNSYSIDSLAVHDGAVTRKFKPSG